MGEKTLGRDATEPHWLDPIIEAYKKDVDRTLIRENLKLTPDQRLANLEALLEDAEEIRRAMKAAKRARETTSR
ncbi:MAG TPA: hypothetical protein VLJ39_09390 [Tepidisphaeraceae bacterium]|nr:hypothetical protein [Tepidisphaeraceae bacterium]